MGRKKKEKEKKLSELTPEELVKLCDTLSKYISSIDEDFGILLYLSSGENGAMSGNLSDVELKEIGANLLYGKAEDTVYPMMPMGDEVN